MCPPLRTPHQSYSSHPARDSLSRPRGETPDLAPHGPQSSPDSQDLALRQCAAQAGQICYTSRWRRHTPARSQHSASSSHRQLLHSFLLPGGRGETNGGVRAPVVEGRPAVAEEEFKQIMAAQTRHGPARGIGRGSRSPWLEARRLFSDETPIFQPSAFNPTACIKASREW